MKTKSQFMLVDLNKTLFYCFMARSFNRLIPYVETLLTYHNQDTKNSVEKMVGFLPKDNDQRKGGQSQSILLDVFECRAMCGYELRYLQSSIL